MTRADWQVLRGVSGVVKSIEKSFRINDILLPSKFFSAHGSFLIVCVHTLLTQEWRSGLAMWEHPLWEHRQWESRPEESCEPLVSIFTLNVIVIMLSCFWITGRSCNLPCKKIFSFEKQPHESGLISEGAIVLRSYTHIQKRFTLLGFISCAHIHFVRHDEQWFTSKSWPWSQNLVPITSKNRPCLETLRESLRTSFYLPFGPHISLLNNGHWDATSRPESIHLSWMEERDYNVHSFSHGALPPLSIFSGCVAKATWVYR